MRSLLDEIERGHFSIQHLVDETSYPRMFREEVLHFLRAAPVRVKQVEKLSHQLIRFRCHTLHRRSNFVEGNRRFFQPPRADRRSLCMSTLYDQMNELPWYIVKLPCWVPGYNVVCWTLGGLLWVATGAKKDLFDLVRLAPAVPIVFPIGVWVTLIRPPGV